jgi:glucose/arabinose dehydrogenase
MNKVVVWVVTLTCSYNVNALEAELVFDGLNVPWAIEFSTPAQAYVSERNGAIVQVDFTAKSKVKLPTPNNVYTGGQGGLFDLVLSPLNSNKLYLTYSKNSKSGAVTALGVLDTEHLEAGWETLFTASMVGSGGRHFGSRLLLDRQHIYMTVGERGERDAAQDLTNHNGTIVRLLHDGRPADNPSLSSESLPEIYSYGHRNPQGITRDSDGQIWAIEHGPRGGDELNRIVAGANYGWPLVSHGKEYWGPISVGDGTSAPGMVDPDVVYIPSIAPGSLLFYSGERYPSLSNKWLAGSLKLTHINVISQNSGELEEELRLFESLNERIRDITVSPDDYLYFTTDSGKIYKIVTH